MDAGTYNPVISPRGSWRRTFTFNADPPIDFTGCEARSEIRDAKEGATLFASVSETPSPDGYIVIPSEETNQLHIYFSPLATGRMKDAKRAYWDLFVEYPNGEDVPKVMEGKVTIKHSVTEPSHD
ncbi:MAG TPA: hypothetical protein VIT65_13885 [Microlunatus sp.]